MVQAVEIYEALASEDNMLALRNLAICFISGRGVRRNAKKGLLLLFPLALWCGCLLHVLAAWKC
jgi:TPR repeat protein